MTTLPTGPEDDTTATASSDERDLAASRLEGVRAIYSSTYAERYATTWQDSELWQAETRNYVASIGGLLHEGDRWLDVGCGTGYFLSRFPGVSRAGLDLSAPMLEHARRNNSDALLFREGDFTIDIDEWHDEWDLVTSTGQPWSYLSTIDEIEVVAHNMARWVKPGGTLMVQPPDITDLTGHRIPYHFTPDRPPAVTNAITGVVWTCYEHDVTHRDMIWPSLDQWVQWLALDFERIEISNWPHDPPFLPEPRRILVATGKRRARTGEWAELAYEPLPDRPAPSTPDENLEPAAPYEAATGEPVPDDAAWASLKAHADREQARADAERARAERAEALVADLRAAAAAIETPVEPAVSEPEPAPPVTRATPIAVSPTGPADLAGTARRLYHLPLADLVGRYAPWKPRFWRGVKRRIG